MRYVLYIPVVIAVALALAIPGTEEPARQDLLTGWVAVMIGLWAALSGARAVAEGRVLVKSRHAERAEQPGTFWATVIVFRFGLAAIFFAAGLWKLL